MPSSPWAKGSHRSRHFTNCRSSFSSVSHAIPVPLALTARKVFPPSLCQWASMRRIAFARRERYGVFLISGWTRDVGRRSRARIKNHTFRLRTIYSKLIVSVACIGFETRDEIMFEGVPARATFILSTHVARRALKLQRRSHARISRP